MNILVMKSSPKVHQICERSFEGVTNPYKLDERIAYRKSSARDNDEERLTGIHEKERMVM